MKIKIILLVVFVFFIAFQITATEAESFSMYVDSSGETDGDGEKNSPFKNLEDAIKEAKKGDVIFLANGRYEGKLEIPESIKIYGESRDKTIIEGGLIANDGVYLENLTITGGKKGILMQKNSSIALKKCVVRDATWIGIDAVPGNGKIIVSDSKIVSNGKGFYVQQGNQVRITGSIISKNREEGIDIRNNVDGIIESNEIYGNLESGIEIILGKTDLTVADNYISENGSSGISIQYYQEFNEGGELILDNNKIKKNSNFGLDCKITQKGIAPDAYWKKSTSLKKNYFSGNAKGEINSFCEIYLGDDSEKIIESQIVLTEPEIVKNPVDLEQEIVEQKKDEEAEMVIREKLNSFDLEMFGLQGSIESLIFKIEDIGKWAYLFQGPGQENITKIEREIELMKEKITALREFAYSSPTEGFRMEIEEKVVSFEADLTQKESYLIKRKRELNFWDRLNTLI